MADVKDPVAEEAFAEARENPIGALRAIGEELRASGAPKAASIVFEILAAIERRAAIDRRRDKFLGNFDGYERHVAGPAGHSVGFRKHGAKTGDSFCMRDYHDALEVALNKIGAPK